MRHHILAIVVFLLSITVSVLAVNGNWKNPSSWNGISRGMSERQVVSILGKPTSAKDLGSMRTLFYRGDVAGSGFISGSIKLDEDRVWQVNKPVF